jgi:hypothetical protein
MKMANTTQEELYQSFLTVSGQQTSALGNATALLADVIAQVGEEQSSNPAPVAANQTQAGSNGSGSTAGTVGTTMLEAGLGLPILIAGLVKVFGGGGTSTPAPLVKYAMPAAVDFQAAESQGQVSGLDYDQMGTPRSYAAAGTSARANGSGSGTAPQITFNVQAMDARSFMDRSGDIALAVRDAMLNLNSINDVVNDL